VGTEATPLATAPTSPKPGIRPTRVVGWVALCAIALAPIVARSGYLSSIGCQIATSAIIVVGLGLLMGYAGQISLGHAAFYAVGAYSSAILTTKAGLHPLLALCAGAAASALLAFVVGTPALRLHGHYLAMFTLGLGIIVQIAIEQGKRLTNGFDGIAGIPALDLGFMRLDSDPRMYGATVVVLIGCVWAARNLVDSRPGRALRALHESEEAASACGVDVPRAKLEVFVLSAVMAAVAGSLYAHTIQFVSPEPFGVQFSVQLVVMMVVGGSTSVGGPVAGAALFTVVKQLLQDAGEKVRWVGYLDTVLFGSVLVLVVVFCPKGLAVVRLPAILRGTPRAEAEGGDS